MFKKIIYQGRTFLLASAVQAAFSLGEKLENRDGLITHKRIYEALAANDAEAAENMVRQHSRRGCELLLMMVKTRKILCDGVDELEAY